MNRVRSAAGLAALFVIGALPSLGCCYVGLHHQRRMGPRPELYSEVPSDPEIQAPGGRQILRFGSADSNAPALLLLHEVTGATPEVMELAARLQQEGYTVYLPILFGERGEPRLGGGALLSQCLSGDFNCWKNESSPLARDLNTTLDLIGARHSNSKLGVIGMCLTGNFPLLLAQHSRVFAAVASQPAVPVIRGSKPGLSRLEMGATRKALHEKRRTILYLRFSQDCLSPKIRMASTSAQLARLVEEHEFTSSSKEHHSVLTDSLMETPEAWSALLDYLERSLKSPDSQGLTSSLPPGRPKSLGSIEGLHNRSEPEESDHEQPNR